MGIEIHGNYDKGRGGSKTAVGEQELLNDRVEYGSICVENSLPR